MNIKTIYLLIFTFMILILQSVQADDMKWWREARFGLFIHWGLYAVPAGSWNDETEHAEWIRTTAEIPLDVYDQFRNEFNPIKFDADEWVRMAKEAGMEYIVITSKHHDGFCLFDSEHTDFDIMSTPFKRDIMKELSDAAHKEGIKICWYHSIMDWHHPDYLPRRKWEKGTRSTDGADYERYVKYMKDQLRELVEKYGDIGVLWFDGEWEDTWDHERGKDLYKYVKGLQPSIIINNRVDKGRTGMAGLTKDGGYLGDFGTPEQEIPPTGLPSLDWETCMTMNDHWGYNKNDDNWKSSKDLLQKLADIASKGGNFLLNVGPTAEGLFPNESIERLEEIGKWMNINSESIYGTSASPFEKLNFGRCTQRKIEGGTRLYFHVFDWPMDGTLIIPGVTNNVKNIYMLSDPKKKMDFSHSGVDIVLSAPIDAPDSINSVIVVDIEGSPDIVYAPGLTSSQNVFIDTLQVFLSQKSKESSTHFTLDGTDPDINSPVYKTPILLSETTLVKAASFREGKRVSPFVEKYFIRDYLADRKINGLTYRCYEGNWEKVPDFENLTPTEEGRIFEISIENRNGKDEYFGLEFRGKLKIAVPGNYTFFLSSNDGSTLHINDQLVIDNDGLHGTIEKSGTIDLKAGKHDFKLCYFQAGGSTSLELLLMGSDGVKKKIPVSMLFASEQ